MPMAQFLIRSRSECDRPGRSNAGITNLMGTYRNRRNSV